MSQLILFEQQKNVGIITLNRANKLNALNFEMCKALDECLVKWQDDASIKAVIIRGNGERSFCAGGDVATIYHNGDKKISDSLAFFDTEYTMNARIFHFKKPYIALLHGIVMGGGMGISMHGSTRIVDPDVVMAMPETGIGFFPDVGASYFLSHAPGELGVYLGLTGARITANDAHFCHFADYCIKKDNFDELVNRLIHTDKAFDSVLSEFSQPFGSAPLTENIDTINECFAHSRIEDIFDNLIKQNSRFAEDTLEVLKSKSPTSLKVTLQQLRTAKGLNFDECMAMERRMVKTILTQKDFYEGVRAVVVDKDYKPAWSSTNLE